MHYSSVARAFDEAAESYDREIETNPIMSYMRSVSLECLRRAFSSSRRLLEIGCGTGREAMELAKEEREIVAIDVSEKMVELTNHKAKEHGASVRALRMPASQISALLDEYGEGYFDGCYSSFGALNCEPGIGDVPEALSALLAPGSPAVFSVMNRRCLSEIVLNLLAFRKDVAVRRLGGSSSATVPRGSANKITARLFSPAEIRNVFSPHFRQERLVALPFLMPPPYMSRAYRVLSFLRPLDGVLSAVYPFNSLGDHFLIEMRNVRAWTPA